VLAAQEAIPKAEKAPSSSNRERDYVTAARTLCHGFPHPSRAARDRAYSDAMGLVRHKYPDDVEATTLYGLSLLSIARQGEARAYELQMEAANLVQPTWRPT
jgi:hypothetical protein